MEQISLFDYMNERKAQYEKRYQIPRGYQETEHWHDDWHYTDLELPTESKVYYVIHKCFKSEHYNYTYEAYAYGRIPTVVNGKPFIRQDKIGCFRLLGWIFRMYICGQMNVCR